MLIQTQFCTGKDEEEILPVSIETFPFYCATNYLECGEEKRIPWHWHNLFEINYVVKGELACSTTDSSYIIEKGEADFINTGVLHSATALGEVPCEYYTILFDMHFLSGMYNSVYEEKYFLPIMRNDALAFWKISPDSYEHLKMVEAVLRTVQFSRDEPFGYEFDVRSTLSDFWRMLLLDTRDVRPSSAPKNSLDTERIKTMTRFIREHCTERIGLEEIAASAGVSTRECTRCFKRSISLSPITYLTQTRVSAAADMLAGTAKSIIEISEDCGFSSPSYFGKVFRETIGCTPKEYRDKDAAGGSPWYYATEFNKIERRRRRDP